MTTGSIRSMSAEGWWKTPFPKFRWKRSWHMLEIPQGRPVSKPSRTGNTWRFPDVSLCVAGAWVTPEVLRRYGQDPTIAATPVGPTH